MSSGTSDQDPPLAATPTRTAWRAARAQGLSVPVALTGGSGFVGSHLVDALVSAGVPCRVLVRDRERIRWVADRPVRWVEGSLAEAQSLRELVTGAGTVFHLAGLVRADRAADFDRANRQGTAALVEALRETAPEARLIHVSSLAAAGPSPEVAGIAPEDEPHPVSDYGRSKLAAEEVVRRDFSAGLWTIVRPPAIYGPRDTDVLEFFRMAARGLFVLPAGERWLTVAYVGDVVDGLLAAAVLKPSGRVLHLGERAPRRLEGMLQTMAASGGCRARLLRLPPAVVRSVGFVSAALRRAGCGGAALTRDKVREILARHWTARTIESLDALGLEEETDFAAGCELSWQWYRQRGWLQ